MCSSDLPRQIVLAPGAPAQTAAFHFDAPAFAAGTTARCRLLLVPHPLIASSDDDYKSKLTEPGITRGVPTQISSAMQPELTGEGVTIVAEDNPTLKSNVDQHPYTEWFWDVTAAKPKNASLRLDLYDSNKQEPAPFPIHFGDFATSSRHFSWLWLLLLLVPVVGLIWYLLHRPKATPRKPVLAPAPPPSARNVLRSDGAYLLTLEVLVIYNTAERQRIQAFCEHLSDNRLRFNLGTAGFPNSSTRWQADFKNNLESCDAILILLTASALGEKWFNWQLEKAIELQNQRDIPSYAAALDEQVLAVSRTVALLQGLECHPPTPQGQAELKASLEQSEPFVTRQIRCFISYSHRHREFAARLCQDLNKAGIRAWMDVTGLLAGSAWEDEIAKAIEASTHVLFLLTSESVKSDGVKNEIDWARQKNRVIIPVMEDNVELPFGLLGTQYVSFMEGYDAGIMKLLSDLSASRPTRKVMPG